LPEPARTTLLAYVDDEVSPEAYADLRSILENARRDRSWALGPPTFIETEVDGIHTIGCELDIYAARDDEGNELGPELGPPKPR
jgi:hypothetical protein